VAQLRTHAPVAEPVDRNHAMRTNETAHCQRYESPVGVLTLVASGVGLRAVLWPDDRVERVPLPMLTRDPSLVLNETARQLDEWFAAKRTTFELPLDLRGTPFQVAAWHALADIPFGRTATYGEQAARLGRPTAVRAIGAANGRNPVSIVLPCHRVVGANGSLTGFAGGLETKRWLLDFEQASRPKA
jgi:methylated-DNA-[protein]-cysteine S-methyltransferase